MARRRRLRRRATVRRREFRRANRFRPRRRVHPSVRLPAPPPRRPTQTRPVLRRWSQVAHSQVSIGPSPQHPADASGRFPHLQAIRAMARPPDARSPRRLRWVARPQRAAMVRAMAAGRVVVERPQARRPARAGRPGRRRRRNPRAAAPCGRSRSAFPRGPASARRRARHRGRRRPGCESRAATAPLRWRRRTRRRARRPRSGCRCPRPDAAAARPAASRGRPARRRQPEYRRRHRGNPAVRRRRSPACRAWHQSRAAAAAALPRSAATVPRVAPPDAGADRPGRRFWPRAPGHWPRQTVLRRPDWPRESWCRLSTTAMPQDG